jgi:predicted O-methyltransferase YrrM
MFTEQWFHPPSQRALAWLARSTTNVNGTIVEVGCWEGRSTVALARAVAPDVVHAVDTWHGSPGEPSADLAAERDVFATFVANVAELTAGNVVPHRVGWRGYFAEHAEPIRFLHIDAEHTYREVFDNIEAALPLMAAGAVMCGDDAHHEPVQQAVIEHFGNRAARSASLWWVKL